MRRAVLLLLWLASAPAVAAPPDGAPASPVAQPAPVLVLGSGQDRTTTRLAQELQLAGEPVVRRPGSYTFTSRPLREQLNEIRSMGVQARAVLWVVRDPDTTLYAHIAVLEDERAVIRVVRAGAEWDDPIAGLALATREILAVADSPLSDDALAQAASEAPEPPPPPPPAPPEPDATWALRVLLGADLPTQDLALGPWFGADVEGTVRPQLFGMVWGLSVGARMGDQRQLRGVFRGTGRIGPGLFAAGLDVTGTPWATRVQPRLEIGFTAPLPVSTVAEFRLRWSPTRDLIIQDETRLYDSGRIEIGLFFGAVRKISGG